MKNEILAWANGAPGLVLIYMFMPVLIEIALRNAREPGTIDFIAPLLAVMAIVSTAMDSGLPSILTDSSWLRRENPINAMMNLAVFATLVYIFCRSMMGESGSNRSYGRGASADVAMNRGAASTKEGSARGDDGEAPP